MLNCKADCGGQSVKWCGEREIWIMEKLKEHKHQVAYIVLVVVILLLLSRGKQGRYTLVAGQRGGAFVLDTRTSQLWIRAREGNMNMGTNEKPVLEKITRRVKVKTFEEIGIKSETSKNNK